jgi:tripartite ATP-independent transporter DctP family solute receptor
VTRIKEASEAITKETNGLVDLQVYPNSQLGSEPDMFSQTRSGALDFMSTSGVNQTVVPVGGINAIAFAFETYDRVWAAMDGDLGNHVRAQFEKVNLFVFPKMLDNGYRNITSGAKPINNPDDMKGFKIRVPGNQLWVTMFKALGAAPTPVNFGELYAALQTRVVDGQENPLALISSAKLYEVQKFIALSEHIWDGHYIFANQKKWRALPDDVRGVVTKHLSTAAVREREDIVVLNASVIEQLGKAGVAFNKPDKQAFRTGLQSAGFYVDWKGKFGGEAWGLLEKYTGTL